VFAEARRWHVPDPYGGQVAPLGPDREDVGRAATIALLRKLAEAYAPQPHEDGQIWHFLGHADLNRIADEIEAPTVKPPAEAVARRRDLLRSIAKTAIGAQLTAIPADLTTWAAALGATEYKAWRLKSGDITVTVTALVDDRPIRVAATSRACPRS
jgi:hypothetical protein